MKTEKEQTTNELGYNHDHPKISTACGLTAERMEEITDKINDTFDQAGTFSERIELIEKLGLSAKEYAVAIGLQARTYQFQRMEEAVDDKLGSLLLRGILRGEA